jgi:hypothetical protein
MAIQSVTSTGLRSSRARPSSGDLTSRPPAREGRSGRLDPRRA